MCEYLNEQIENNNLDIHNIALHITFCVYGKWHLYKLEI